MLIDFFKIVSNLKDVSRQGWIDKVSIDNPESVADHSYSMAVMSMILSDLNELNSEKVLKMCLLHDLAESITGDYTIDKITKQEKTKLENTAMEKIFSNLSDNLKDNYTKLWNEFQENNTDEAKFVHQVDKLEMALQAKIYSEKGFSKEKLETFFHSAKDNIKNPALVELLTKIINQ